MDTIVSFDVYPEIEDDEDHTADMVVQFVEHDDDDDPPVFRLSLHEAITLNQQLTRAIENARKTLSMLNEPEEGEDGD